MCYYPQVDNTEDCFKTIQRKTSRHTLCSWRNDAETKELAPLPLHSNNHNSHLRLRRSQHFDPTDPLGSENPKSRTMNYQRQNKEHERERTSNVSRETITSCDDPLHVLLSKSPVSPNLQKEKKYKQVAPIDPFWTNAWALKVCKLEETHLRGRTSLFGFYLKGYTDNAMSRNQMVPRNHCICMTQSRGCITKRS